MQIITQVQEDAAVGEEIKNVAQVVLNDNVVMETNPAVVILVDSEEKQQVEPEAPKEDTSKEDGEKNVESNDNPPSEKSADASVNQVQATNGFTINEVDSYGAQGLTLFQFDGNNPSTTPKASVPITGVSGTALNGLALSLTEDAFYTSIGGTNLYRIAADGRTQLVTTLEGATGNAVIYDGKYYYSYGSDGKSFLGSYDLSTGNKTSTEIKGLDNSEENLGGDIVADGDGYLWFYRGNSVMQLDRKTGNILRNVPITNSDGVAIEWGVRGISFLPSGKMLLAGGNSNPKFYILDQETNSTTYLGAMTGAIIFDLASAVTPKFEPNSPVLESEKTAKIQEKAEGNTDQAHPEVGDTLLYTIKTKNTVEDSLVKNLTISDELPEGLEYVAGSLKVDGESVTDAEDNDNGHYKEGTVVGEFGDITDTDEHTLTFFVTVGAGQAGKDIKNIATVGGGNMDEPDNPEDEVIVYPRDPVLESKKSAKNLDESKDKFEVGDTIVYTIETRNTVTESLVTNLVISDTLPEGLEYVSGSLQVDGVSVTEEEDSDKGHYKDGTVVGQFGDVEDTKSHTLVFHAKIVSGQSGKTIQNVATVEGEEIKVPDSPEETVKVDPKDPKLESEKSATIQEKAEGNTDTAHPEVGDTLLYTIKTKNTVEDSLVESLTISDELPEGLEYVNGSLKVDEVSVTDAEDEDNGHYKEGTVVGAFGDITDTDEHTLTFLVIVGAGQAGKDIKNIATVGGENMDEPDNPEDEVIVYPRDPVLESKKSVKNVDESKDTFKVGDTIVYTIQARNPVSDSLVENLTITDTLPAGLEYVEDSIEVSHEGKGEFKDGKIIATFGDVTDMEWRTVTFKAKIQSNQYGKTIKNTAEVSSDNVPDPNQPEAIIEVDPKGSTGGGGGGSKNPPPTPGDPKDPTPTPGDPKDPTPTPGDPKDPTPTPGDPKDPTPTPGESKDPTPTPGESKGSTSTPKQDELGAKTPSSETDKGDGKKLPNTSTNLFNYGFIGVIAVLAGLVLLRRRKSNVN